MTASETGTNTLSERITRVRNRLLEIEEERSGLEGEDFARKAELLDEEHTLEAQLAELRDEAARAGAGIAEKEAGAGSDYESVPEIPEDVHIEEAGS